MKQKLIIHEVYKCPYCWNTLGIRLEKDNWCNAVYIRDQVFYETTCERCGTVLQMNMMPEAVATFEPNPDIKFKRFNL